MRYFLQEPGLRGGGDDNENWGSTLAKETGGGPQNPPKPQVGDNKNWVGVSKETGAAWHDRRPILIQIPVFLLDIVL